MTFRWIEWNIEHIAAHGITPDEAEAVVRRARRPFPLKQEDGKWLVQGPGTGGRLIQVIFIRDPDGTLFAIHARPLTDQEKRRFRKRIRP